MKTTYTKQEVLDLVTDCLKRWNVGRPLPDHDIQIIGIVNLALPEPRQSVSEVTARVGRQYPKTVTA